MVSRIRGCLLAMLVPAMGCLHHGVPVNEAIPFAAEGAVMQNPIFVPNTDREFVWNQIVDTVDDYFKIVREDRVRIVGGVLSEGRIETSATVGATILEPWRRDSTAGFERLHSTLQTIRRRAQVRVVPAADGYSVEVVVFKELEDVSRPEHATVGQSTSRHDGSLVRDDPTPDAGPVTLGWIPLGRDVTLEQRMLDEIYGRLAVSPAETL